MAKSTITFLLAAVLAITSTTALQVTPNSQCSSVCLDQLDKDKSDPNASNTAGSDIICHDDGYASPVGQKYKQCLDCLQNSSDKSTTESDLQWYFYNLRYAVNSCLFGLHNASDPLSSPCSIQTSCGPLVAPLQDGMEDPSAGNRYSYCDAFGSSFLGNRLAPCTKCLRLTEEQKYMSNFMIALKAGCEQRPEVGKVIGLDGTLFSAYAVNITTSTPAPTTAPVSENKGGLSVGAYAGIGIAAAVVVGILIAACIIGRKKKQAWQKRDHTTSDLDSRFGNGRITVPVNGAYGDPYSSKPSPYHEVHVITPPEKPFAGQRDSYRSHEDYLGPHRPVSTISHHTIQNSRTIGAATPYKPYDPSKTRSRTASYSPAPSPEALQHSPHSIANSTTQLHRPSLSVDASSFNKAGGSSRTGSGLPKIIPPKRTPSNATDSDVVSRPARMTRDLSLPRDEQSNISGPLVNVDTRFDIDDDARKRAERQRLFEKGFQPRASRIEEGPSPDGEQWPGKY